MLQYIFNQFSVEIEILQISDSPQSLPFRSSALLVPSQIGKDGQTTTAITRNSLSWTTACLTQRNSAKYWPRETADVKDVSHWRAAMLVFLPWVLICMKSKRLRTPEDELPEAVRCGNLSLPRPSGEQLQKGMVSQSMDI